MASSVLDRARIASCSSSSAAPWFKPFRPGHRLSASGGQSRGYRAGRMLVVCGLRSREEDFSALQSRTSPWRSSEECGRGCSVVGRKLGQNGPLRSREGRAVVTMALPIDAYWITAAQAVAVAGLMGGIAAVTGVFINIRIEVQALAEFKELEEKGLLPDEIVVPDGKFDLESPLYIFQNKELSSAGTSRNRPIRDEFQPEVEKELKAELAVETASKE